MIIVRRPQQQPPDRGRKDRLGVQRFCNRLEPVERQLAVFANRGDNADALLFTERHAHATARFDRDALREQIVKGTGQRNGQGYVGDGHVIFLT
jgi:hypothetical protein